MWTEGRPTELCAGPPGCTSGRRPRSGVVSLTPPSVYLLLPAKVPRSCPVIPHTEGQIPGLTLIQTSQPSPLSRFPRAPEQQPFGVNGGREHKGPKRCVSGLSVHQGCRSGRTRESQTSQRQPGALSYQTRSHRDVQLWLQISTRCHMEDTQLCLRKERRKKKEL